MNLIIHLLDDKQHVLLSGNPVKQSHGSAQPAAITQCVNVSGGANEYDSFLSLTPF